MQRTPSFSPTISYLSIFSSPIRSPVAAVINSLRQLGAMGTVWRHIYTRRNENVFTI